MAAHRAHLQPRPPADLKGSPSTTPSSPSRTTSHPPCPSSDSCSGFILTSSHAHNEQHGNVSSSSSSSSSSKARGRSRSPFKRHRQRDSNRDVTRPTEHDSRHQATQSIITSPHTLQRDFEELLTTRDVPADLRSTLDGLSLSVKESLVRNQASVSLSALGAFSRSDKIHPQASFSHSCVANSSQACISSGADSPSRMANSRHEHTCESVPSSSRRGRSTSPGKSLFTPLSNPSPSRISSSPAVATATSSSPGMYARLLLNTASPKLEIDSLRRLRVLLSTESSSWLADFLFTERGYEGLLRRIGELIEMEWRDEIHDDKALHELLRGLVALGATDRGRLALTSLLFRPYAPQLATQPARSAHLPTTSLVGAPAKEVCPPELPVGWERHPPFGPLTALLLSDRKPGELNTRRLIVELLSILPSLSLPAGLKDDVFDSLKSNRVVSSCYGLFCSEQPISSSHLLLLLLHNPISSRSQSLLPFISQSHHPRPFKAYLSEVSGVVRDYFWIFCHGQNRFYDWEAMGKEARKRIDGPSVPGGMTGGVEFEAIACITSHLKLINRISEILATSSDPTSNAPLLFHIALFDSGLERLIMTLRRASQQYYGPMHLALAQYIHLARCAKFRLSADIQSWFERRLQLRNAPEIEDCDGGGMGLNFASVQLTTEVKAPVKSASPTTMGPASPQRPATVGKEGVLSFPQGTRAVVSDPPLHALFPAAGWATPSKPGGCNTNVAPITVPISTTAAEMSPFSSKPPVLNAFPPSSASRPSGQGSVSGDWLRQSSTALLAVTSSISSESFFDEAWPTEEEAVACSVPLPASPAKESGSAAVDKVGRARDWQPSLMEGEKASELASKDLIFSSLGDSAGHIGGAASPKTTTISPIIAEPTAVGTSVPPMGLGTARDRIRLWEGRAKSTAGRG